MIYRFSQCELDTERLELRRDGELQAVEPQVFSLLVHLIENREHVVSKDDLIEAVWKGRIVSDATMSSRINAGRRAVGDSGKGQTVIKTMPRRGFRFVAEVLPVEAPQSSERSVAFDAEITREPTSDTSIETGDRPSVAVLPFKNMSGDPEQEYFSDGITEDIITELSRYPDLLVIARNSSFAYKGSAVDVKKVAQELGVRYVLEGSVRKAGNRIRVTAQLIDATSGGHLWAERFDRNLEDIFAVQDEITQIVVGTLGPKLQAAGADVVMKMDPARLTAYDLVLRALAHWHRLTKADHEETERLSQAAINIDPTYARAYAVLALNLMQTRNSGFADDPEACLAAGLESARKAVSLDNDDAEAHSALAMLCLFAEHHEQSITECRRAIELNPNFAEAHAHLANALTCSGRTEEALAELEVAIRLNPHQPSYYLMMLGRTHFVQGDYQAAIAPLERAVNVSPSFTPARTTLAACYSAIGRIEEARTLIANLLSELPSLTLAFVQSVTPFKDPKDRERFVTFLKTAGLAE